MKGTQRQISARTRWSAFRQINPDNMCIGKIQGDGRKFHIYRLQPKSTTKGEFFPIFLSLIVSSWRHVLQISNKADEVLLGKWPR